MGSEGYFRNASQDKLSQSRREDRIYIFTLDNVLADDIYERIHHDPRMESYQIIRTQKTGIKGAVADIDKEGLP